MPYSTSNPPHLTMPAFVAGASPSVWGYRSADPSATIDAAGYITDGYKRGMKVGDLVIAEDTVNKIISSHRVVSVNATTGAVDLSNGTVIGSDTNSD